MRSAKITHSLMLSLVVAGAACASGKPIAAVAVGVDDGQTQSSATAVQSFNAVEGADLMAKLDAARERARAKQSPYWSAYAFDVRSGVAIDPAIREFHGSINTMGDTSVFVGTTADGMTVETRSLAVFLLRDVTSNQITRMEIYNLERKREYSGYPVYWLGRANNEESLNYLRALAAAAPLDNLSERAVLGIALHDDARVGGMLKTFVGTSPNQRIRSSSVYWLGQVGGEQAFLAGLVRNEAEDRKLRRQAAHAIGQSHDRGAMPVIQSLYDAVKEVEIRQGLISAAANTTEAQPAFTFLLGVARNDVDVESRRNATRQLGRFQREDAIDELFKIFANDTNLDVKRAALRALAETKSARAQTRLMDIARTDNNPELRKQAIRVMSERGEAAVEDLLKLFDSEQLADVRRSALQALSEIKSARVEEKLFAVAGGNDTVDVRKQAIRLLGERAGKKSFEFLSATAQNPDGNTEVQVQAVRSISEHHTAESVPILIKIAKSHPNQLVRKQAIRSLGESGDPRAVEFFREVLAK
ncbi:MAG TPA: HEAT repeat domain-containing protein [Pyrinomonadaceae bacterium]|nr:HEAT repeat domain-containing protein [Pyrinomonadaceae bacterium]